MLDFIASVFQCPFLRDLALAGILLINLLISLLLLRKVRRIENVRSVKDFLNDK